jgi:hypothetical protein
MNIDPGPRLVNNAGTAMPGGRDEADPDRHRYVDG